MAHILLAKDDVSSGDFLGAALKRAGHDVDIIHDGLEALSLLQSDHYDLLLTDIVMPSMDGVELVRRVSDCSPHTKSMFIAGFSAVAVTQTSPQASNERALKTRLSKPLHLRELPQNVEQLLAA